MIPNPRRAAAPAALSLLLLAACSAPERSDFQGYVEGEYLYLAAPQAGYLKSLDAPRGHRVAGGDRLFEIAADPDDQALAEAQARAGSAREKLENLREPRRTPEIAALEAQLAGASVAHRLAEAQLQRQQTLLRQQFVSASALDDARARRDQAVASEDAARQQLATARITLGRVPELRGAEADLRAADAQAAQKRWTLARKTVAAPTAGEISDTYYRPGEWIPAGAPVASLLPDTRRRLRFYVPETVVGTLQPGQAVEARCDGCAAPIRATIDFIAPQAEYTPPVIYSRGSREKLVFRVEAAPTPDDARRLRPGLPVDVRLAEHRDG